MCEVDFPGLISVIIVNIKYIVHTIVHQYHEKVGHLGLEATLGTTRQKYWIVSGTNTVKHGDRGTYDKTRWPL